MAERLKGLLDRANSALGGLLGDAPKEFAVGAVSGVPGIVGDLGYTLANGLMNYTPGGRLFQDATALLGAPVSMPEMVDVPGTSDYLANQAGYAPPTTLSGQIGRILGGIASPGPGEWGAVAKLVGDAPLLAMFLGAKAKTAMPDVLEYAQAMDKMGKSADEIWQTTAKLGQPWFKGADGKWRFEISDANADYRPGRAAQEALSSAEGLFAQYDDALYLRNYMDREGKGVGEAKDWYRQTFGREPHQYAGQLAKGTDAEFLKDAAANAEKNAPSRLNWAAPLDNVLEHPELYSAHPALKDTRYYMMQPKDMLGDARGQFGTGGIGVNPDIAYMLGEGKSTTLHEAQHAIQQREGFARGGSVEQMARERDKLRGRINYLNQELAQAAKDLDTYPKGSAEYKSARETYDAAMAEKLNMDLDIVQGDPYLAYKRLAGESEARNTQARMNMNMDERIALPPWLTQDVPTDQQIVRFGDGPGMSVERNGEPIPAAAEFAARREGKSKPYREAMGGQ